MSSVKNLKVKHLELDLDNYRTTSQDGEIDAIKAMIAISPGNFYGVFESILQDGFLPIENLVVQKIGERYTVKEGNRRTASLKICLGLINTSNFTFSNQLIDRVSSLGRSWKEANASVPCTIYTEKEEGEVNRIVGLIHAKGKKAGRDPWKAVAKARFNRDEENGKEPGLAMLESFISRTTKLSADQKYKWSGTYPITVLDEAIKKVAPALHFKDAPELGKKFSTTKKLNEIDKLIYDIGTTRCKFKTIRADNPNFLDLYNLRSDELEVEGKNSEVTDSQSAPKNETTDSDQGTDASDATGPERSEVKEDPSSTNGSGDDDTSETPNSNDVAHSVNSLRHVKNLLTGFQPRGDNRAKVVTIRDEMQKLSLNSTPIAFCLLLRSMFEISGKAYAKDHNIRSTNSKGFDIRLIELLKKCVKHLTQNGKNASLAKELHGAIVELATPDNLVSVTSMNQLVHHPFFAIPPKDIAVKFNNVFPLLVKLNQ